MTNVIFQTIHLLATPQRDLSPDENYCTKPSLLAQIKLLQFRAHLRALGRQMAQGPKPRQFPSRQFRYQCLGAPVRATVM